MRFTSLTFLTTCAGALAAPLSYNRDIRPILSENCFACHGPDKASREAKLRLDIREAAIEKEAIIPGDLKKSDLIFYINAEDEDEIMPPPESHKKLTQAQKDTLAEWIKQGAPYEAHWSFIPAVRPDVPALGENHPIDNFIKAGLKGSGHEMSQPADKATIDRRISFDLTGLPPHLTGTSDPDKLLASPHFGERMAVFWLDLARYADTAGYHSDKVRDVTPYRDYVINSFNKNKPYDQFVTEQLAGDLFKDPTLENYVASAFNRINQVSEEGGIQDKEYIAKYYAERVRTTSGAFLGATMGCAECHDHKFDPFTAKDFYSMQAFFSDIYEKGAYTGHGSYNKGADIKNYPGFKLGKFGPTLNVPSPEQETALVKIQEEKRALEATTQKDSPDLLSAFNKWTNDFLEKIGSSKPQDVVILEDAELPLGGAKTVTNNVHSGSLARIQTSSEAIQHIVDANKKPVTLTEGDTLYSWVWLDPKNPPKQLMLQFHGKNWEHRAWWGEDLIPFGKGSKKADHYRVGNLPATGKWVRLEVPAKSVGLPAGSKVTQLAYTQFGGSVLWDQAGRHTNDSNAVLAGLPEKSRKALLNVKKGKPTDQDRKELLTHYRTIAPSLAPARKKIAELTKQEEHLKTNTRSTLVTLSTVPRTIKLLPRGDWTDDSGEVLLPSTPEFLSSEGQPSKERLTRLDLAKWITARENPLTARAFTNRVWALFFGTGLSRDLQDLGNQGQWPTHPELLDWLSVEFVESGWDVKHLVKLIITSKAYRQSSNASPQLMEEDPYNNFYARQNPRRLPAEFIRDNALAVSGLLNPQLGGASARPYQPAGYYAQLNFPKRKYQQHNDENQYRRGVYMHWQRSFLHPMLAAFDAPAREECTAARESSNTPLQALNQLNDPTFVEAARVLATELVAEEKAIKPRLLVAFQRLLNRPPSGEEETLLTELFNKQLKRYKAAPDDAKKLLSIGLTPLPDKIDPVDLAATTTVTRALLNLQETITRY